MYILNCVENVDINKFLYNVNRMHQKVYAKEYKQKKRFDNEIEMMSDEEETIST